MKLRSTTAAAALVIGAMTIGMTTAHADDAPAQPAGINYSTKLVDGKTIVSTLKNGTFELAQQDGATPEDPKVTVVNVKDQQGATAISFPLKFDADGTTIPVKSEVKDDGKVLEVVPEKPADFQPGTTVLAAKPIASATENQKAMSNFSTQFGLAIGIGSFVGTALGAIIGCVVTFVAGCVPGLVAGAGIGGILGTIAAGGPTLIGAGIELLQTLQAPDGTSKWAETTKTAPVTQN
ncbi:hypothetical protein [Nocardia aurantiaca]|uniref:DUF8020 domain-containing protein n=1 Tax=Nocardia aurantiaca TaxID=2675850 RepID=A0A6I3L2P6_9NOCA|nr:hypothetical protein [Nocardia aurantiaca]MTE14796.1 hypothetical protein [Nocardia aurantiaca]